MQMHAKFRRAAVSVPPGIPGTGTPRPPVARRVFLALPWLGAAVLAACVETPPPRTDFPPLNFDYLTKLRLNVATVDVDNAATASTVPGGQHVEALSPIPPADALRLMAQQRLIPSGGDGHAVFVIEDASIVQSPGSYVGNMKVHLDVSSGDGMKSGYAEAHVSRTRTVVDRSVDGTRAALYEMVKQMMGDMNVEFEFQVRHSLRDYLQSSEQVAPTPEPVQQQDLNEQPPPPPPSPASPTPLAPEPAPVSPPAPPAAQ